MLIMQLTSRSESSFSSSKQERSFPLEERHPSSTTVDDQELVEQERTIHHNGVVGQEASGGFRTKLVLLLSLLVMVIAICFITTMAMVVVPAATEEDHSFFLFLFKQRSYAGSKTITDFVEPRFENDASGTSSTIKTTATSSSMTTTTARRISAPPPEDWEETTAAGPSSNEVPAAKVEDHISFSLYEDSATTTAATEKPSGTLLVNSDFLSSRKLQEDEIDSCVLSQEIPFVVPFLVKLNSPKDRCVGSTGASVNNTLAVLSAKDKEKLKVVLLTSFATLAERYCDPYLRNVTSVDILRQGDSPSSFVQSQGDGDYSLTLEVQVLGTLRCQQESELGCNVDKIGLFDSLVQLDPRQREPPTCLCPAETNNNTTIIASNRGPTEAEFMEHFGLLLAMLVPSFDCPDLQVADCAFGTVFQSALAVTFADREAARNASDLIASESLRTLNDLYTPDDPSVCYPEFRVFDSVSVSFQAARRQLQDMSIPTTSSTANGTESSLIGNITSSAPSVSPSSIIDGLFPGPQPLTVILNIGGVCSRCGSGLFLSNDVSTRRRLDEPSFEDAIVEHTGLRRKLEANTTNTTSSNCFCPIDSVISEASVPTIEQFESTLAERLQLEIIQVQEVESSELVLRDEDSFTRNGTFRYLCTNISTTFKKNVTLELQLTCEAAPALSDDDKSRIGLAYANAYNLLRGTVCDPFHLKVASAQVVETDDLRTDGTSLPLRMEVTLVCYGCNPLLTNVYGFPPDFLLEDETTEFNETQRNLYEPEDLTTRRDQEAAEGMCTCNSTLPRRSPLEAEVTDALDRSFAQREDLAVPCIGNTSTCDFGTTFAASALVGVQGDGILDPLEIAKILERAYTNALERLIGGGNATVCNSLFGLVTDTEVYLDFVYNSVDRNANKTARRQLQDLPTVAPTSDAAFTFLSWPGSENNITDTPTAAPTVQVGGDTELFLLDAVGLCNGCPAELIFSNEADGRRRLDKNTYEDKIGTTPVNEYRLLQNILDGEEPESECYCPLGSVEIATDFQQISLREVIQEEVAKIGYNFTVTETVSGLSRVDCVDQTQFSTTIEFRFSAFQWVVNNPNDVQGLGDAIANIYNGLVEEFCDEYFRNSISLTYVAGSLQRSSATRQRHHRELQSMQGCFNYRATFAVTGLCRGCQALGTPIPLFGNSTSNRKLGETTRQPSQLSRNRRLQESGSTCICDSTSISQWSAPSQAAIRAGLEALIPDSLPWAKNPSICGNPVDVERPCPTIPTGPSTIVTLQFYVRRSDDGCLTAADLHQIATDFSDAFNTKKKLERFPCEPQYLQVSNVIIDPSALGGCRRELLRRGKYDDREFQTGDIASRYLQRDFVLLPASMTVTGNIYAANIDAILASEAPNLRSAAASIEETNGGLYEVVTGRATSSPSAVPSAFPSGFPSAFPSEIPTSKPSKSLSDSPTIIFSNTPTSKPSESCPTSSESCSGTVGEILTWCDVFTGTADECCVGTEACVWADQATIFRGSCNGYYACDFGLSALGTITVGTNSCNANYACEASGNTVTSISIDSNSCNGQYACDFGLSDLATITVGTNSCNDDNACAGIGNTATSISIGGSSCNGPSACQQISRAVGETVVSIGDGSCNEDAACQWIGEQLAKSVTVGDGSCTNYYSCYYVGGSEATTVKIESGSCIDDASCYQVGSTKATTVTIGTDSCIGKNSCDRVGVAKAESVTIDSDSCIGDLACHRIGAIEATSVTISALTCTAKDCVDPRICGGGTVFDSTSARYFDIAGAVTCDACECLSSR